MTAPADSYWSIDECRWVRYSAPAVEIPNQRDVDLSTVAVDLEQPAVAVASGDDLHR